MKTSFTLRIILLCTFIQFSPNVNACDCDLLTVPTAYKNADIVILGTVIKIEKKFHVLSKELKDSIEQRQQHLIFGDTIFYTAYTFSVEEKYKTNSHSDTIQIFNGPNISDCDFNFTLYEKYMLYAFKNSLREMYFPDDTEYPYYFSNLCTRTTLNYKEEKRLLNAYGYSQLSTE